LEPRLRVLYNTESVGKKRALVRAAARAQGRFFVFTDSDCVMRHDAIERVMAAFSAHPDIGAVSGHARALNADESLLTRMQDVWYDGQFAIWKASESVYGAVSCVSGPLAAFRREAIFNYLPAWASDSFLGSEFRFATDRQLTGYVLGAPYIGERLKHDHGDSPFVRDENHPVRRWRVEYVRSARVDTLVPSCFRGFARQQVRWKKSFIRNLFFTGSFYWRKGWVPTFLFYSHVMFVLAMPLMAARHLVYLPLQGAFALTALYLLGVFLKGSIWGVAYKVQNPGCSRWIYRPAMSLMTALVFSTLLLYSALTLRRGVWAR
jgi:cellulose synthase/poly-beta-1,6-N-acetylglucosamine synthase-like glycosyltransferase